MTKLDKSNRMERVLALLLEASEQFNQIDSDDFPQATVQTTISLSIAVENAKELAARYYAATYPAGTLTVRADIDRDVRDFAGGF